MRSEITNSSPAAGASQDGETSGEQFSIICHVDGVAVLRTPSWIQTIAEADQFDKRIRRQNPGYYIRTAVAEECSRDTQFCGSRGGQLYFMFLSTGPKTYVGYGFLRVSEEPFGVEGDIPSCRETKAILADLAVRQARAENKTSRRPFHS